MSSQRVLEVAVIAIPPSYEYIQFSRNPVHIDTDGLPKLFSDRPSGFISSLTNGNCASELRTIACETGGILSAHS